MKLLFVINSMQDGGAARVTALLCNKMLINGHQVYLCTNLSTLQIGYYLDCKVQTYSIYSANHNKDKRIKRFFYHIIELRKQIKRIKPDIIIGEQEDATLYSTLANMFMSYPIIGHRHNTFKILGLSRIQRLIYNSCDITVLLHKTDFDYVGDKIKKKCYIYNPCSFSINSIVQVSKKKHVIVVGSLDRWYNKGFDQILKIWKYVSNSMDGWKLVIVGTGDNDNICLLKKLIEEYEIEKSVIFTGYVHNVDEYLSKASIFALPSRVEGFPMVLNEAISQSCACISFDLYGVISEIYSKKAVISVTDGDLNLFAEKLIELMNDESLRINLCKQSIIELKKYTIDNIACQWESLFKRLKCF